MTAAPPTAVVVVCSRCAVRDLAHALHVARAGSTILVRGVQRGNFVVRVPGLTIEGARGAALDGTGRGTVLTIDAPRVTVRDLGIRRSGSDFVAMDSGVRSNASRTLLRNLRVTGSLFGVYLARSNDSVVDHVRIEGRRSVPVPLRGDGLRVWYSANVRITKSSILNARDDLIWFSKGAWLSGNTIRGGRYGIHTMYSDDMTIVSNDVRNCEVGSYAMYGKRLRVEHNIFAENRGSTGYGIGLKAMDNTTVADNAFVSDHVGIYLDNSPSVVGSLDWFSGNLIAYNQTGLASLPSSQGDVLLGNSFIENYRQVAVLGGGTLTKMTWSQGGRGNYWSDYAGYDRDGDGVGDVPYQERSVYGALADLNPRLDLLAFSPAAQAIDFAAKALPLWAPPPALADSAPQMHPSVPRGLPTIATPNPRAPYTLGGLLALALSFAVLIPFRPCSPAVRKKAAAQASIVARGVRKRYGRTLALDGINLEVRASETLALWGPNGSGKTTLLRCLLGIVRCEGEVALRGTYAYVPQQLPPFDMRAGDLMAFVAALRQVAPEETARTLDDAGLGGVRERNIAELSGGQRQRLSVAAARLGSPDMLFLDEPTVGLDLESRGAIVQYLREAKAAGATIVIASHVPEDLATIADRIAVMEEGRIAAVMSPAEFETMIEQRRSVAS